MSRIIDDNRTRDIELHIMLYLNVLLCVVRRDGMIKRFFSFHFNNDVCVILENIIF
jgi:hypothetical protein